MNLLRLPDSDRTAGATRAAPAPPAEADGGAPAALQPDGAGALPFVSAAWLLPACIHTPRLLLRRLRADDVDQLMPILSDPAVTRYLSYAPWTDTEHGRAWCDEFVETNRRGSTAWFVCIDRADGHMVGNCVLFDFIPACDRAELGYMFGRAYWRRGYASEAAAALIAHGFHDAGLRRIETQIHVANLASQELARKLGFTREGRLRKRLANQDGVLNDVFLFGLLRDDLA